MYFIIKQQNYKYNYTLYNYTLYTNTLLGIAHSTIALALLAHFNLLTIKLKQKAKSKSKKGCQIEEKNAI